MGVGFTYPAVDIPALICGKKGNLLKLTKVSCNSSANYANFYCACPLAPDTVNAIKISRSVLNKIKPRKSWFVEIQLIN